MLEIASALAPRKFAARRTKILAFLLMRGGAAVAFAPRALRPRGVAKAATPQPTSEPAQPTKKRRTAVSGSAKSSAAKSAPKIAPASKSAADAPISWFERYAGSMSAEYKHYMQTEWGFPKRGDRPLFEKLSLEGAQAGLSRRFWRSARRTAAPSTASTSSAAPR